MKYCSRNILILRIAILVTLLTVLITTKNVATFQLIFSAVLYTVVIECIIDRLLKRNLALTFYNLLSKWTQLFLICLLAIIIFGFKTILIPFKTFGLALQISGLLLVSLVDDQTTNSQSNKREYPLLRKLVNGPVLVWGTIVGTWFGALLVGLDWNEKWQEWPGPCIVCSILGHLFACIVNCCFTNSTQVR